MERGGLVGTLFPQGIGGAGEAPMDTSPLGGRSPGGLPQRSHDSAPPGPSAWAGSRCANPHTHVHMCARTACVYTPPRAPSDPRVHMRTCRSECWITPGAGQPPARFPFGGEPPPPPTHVLSPPVSPQPPPFLLTPLLSHAPTPVPTVPGSAWPGDSRQSKHLGPAWPAQRPARPPPAHLAGHGVPGRGSTGHRVSGDEAGGGRSRERQGSNATGLPAHGRAPSLRT